MRSIQLSRCSPVADACWIGFERRADRIVRRRMVMGAGGVCVGTDDICDTGRGIFAPAGVVTPAGWTTPT